MQWDISAIRKTYLSSPDESVFLERGRILQEARQKYKGLPPGLRQGKIIEELCERITVVVNPSDILLGRVHEEIPTAQDEAFIAKHPELFVSPGCPGCLDSASIYIPDWGKLLDSGISGLIEEVEQHLARRSGTVADPKAHREWLEGVRVSLLAISRLITRYADAAEQLAEQSDDPLVSTRLVEVGSCCRKVATSPPDTFHEALQLFSIFHMVLSCLIGGRNVTPGRMDQYLFPFYERDIRNGTITRSEGVELLAAMMIGLSQLSGKMATDFQSTKRSPNRFSHYYITLAGAGPDGKNAVNALSFALLDAIRLVDHREPSLSIRYSRDIDRAFWNKAVALMRDRMPIFAYNDHVVIPALVRYGVSEHLARNYAHCGCLNCFIPGHGVPCLRSNHNLPFYILLAITGGQNPETGEQVGPRTPKAEMLRGYDDMFTALREQVRTALAQTSRTYSGIVRRYPLPAWPLFDGHLSVDYQYWEHRTKYADQHVIGTATAVDSLLAIRHLVYERKKLSLTDLVGVLKQNFREHEPLRQYVLHRVPAYGTDVNEVMEAVESLGKLWVEEVDRASARVEGITFRPGFHSWLYNLQSGKETTATPDGRRAGEPLSSDQLPASGKARAPTEMLRCVTHLPHDHTCSGGTTLRLSQSSFKGEEGIQRLSSLIETYFAHGGLQLHFIFADTATLEDAMQHPEKHRDLLVRVTGFSEYFVRLLPEVQRELIRRGGA